jgi:hypothetical protein
MEKRANIRLIQLLPILFGFFIMGFVDVVNISVSYVKQDFGLSDKLANLQHIKKSPKLEQTKLWDNGTFDPYE